MGVVKRILKSDAVRSAACWLGAGYIRLVHATSRWQVVGGEYPQAFWDAGQPFIVAFWHGRLLMTPPAWKRSVPIHMLVSQHRDGRLIADTIGHFGVQIVTGSSSKGGVAALRSMLKLLKTGKCVGITPDGPRGPRMRASEGLQAVARLAGVPIVPLAYSVTRRKTLRSWDRFIVPWPFSRGVYVWGAPITIAKDDDADATRRVIEAALTAVADEADRLTGQPTIEPAPEPPVEAAS